MSAQNRQLSLDIPDYLRALVPYPPGKPLEELEREYGIKKAIKLASNENPLGPSPKALAMLGNALRSLHRYPDGSAYYLKARLAQMLGVTSGEIVLGNGSNEIIDLLVRVFVRPGLEVLSSQPSFLVYQKMVQSVGGRNVVVPLAGNRHDLRSIAKNVNQLTRLIFLDNPNNPTGSVIDRKTFDSFLEELPDHVLIILDEAYMEFTRTSATLRGVDYMGRDRRVVTLRTFSKAYGLAGLRVGYGLMDKDIAGYVERVRQPFNVNTMAQSAALAALDDDEHLKRTLDVTWKGIDFLTEKLHELGCVVLPSETNFVLVDVGRDAKRIYEAMLRLGVIVRAMNSYGFPQHIRITAGLQEENDRCIRALARVLKS